MSTRLSVVPYNVASEIPGFGYTLTNLESGAIGGVQTEFSIQDKYWVIRFGYRIPIGLGSIAISVVTQDVLVQFLDNLIPIDIGNGLSLLLKPSLNSFSLKTRVREILQRDRLDWIYPRSNYLYVETRYYRDKRRGNTFLVKFGSDEKLSRLYTTISIPFNLPNQPLFFLVSAESLPNNLSRHEITYLDYFPFATFLPGNAQPLIISAGDYSVHGLVKGHWRDNLRGLTKTYDLYLKPLQVKTQGFLEALEIVTDIVFDGYYKEPDPDDFIFDFVVEFSVVVNKPVETDSICVLDFVFEPVPPIIIDSDLVVHKTVQLFPLAFYEDLVIGDLVVENLFLPAETIPIQADLVLDFIRPNPDIEPNLFLVADCIFQEETFSFRWDLVLQFTLTLDQQTLPIRHLPTFIIEDDLVVQDPIGRSDLITEFVLDEVFIPALEITPELICEQEFSEKPREPINSDLVIEFINEETLPVKLTIDTVVDCLFVEVGIVQTDSQLVVDFIAEEVPAVSITSDFVTNYVIIEGEVYEIESDFIIWFETNKVQPREIENDLVIDLIQDEIPTIDVTFDKVVDLTVEEISAEPIELDLVIDDSLVLAPIIPVLQVTTQLVVDGLIVEIPTLTSNFDFVVETLLEVPLIEFITTDLVISDNSLFRPALSSPLSSIDFVVDSNVQIAEQIESFIELVAETIVALLSPVKTGDNIVNCNPLYFQVFDVYYDEYCLLSIQSRVSETIRIEEDIQRCNTLETRVYERKADVSCILETTSYIGGELS
jgi:hypothetical protein